MSVTELEKTETTEAKLGIVDCDIHPALTTRGEIAAFLPLRWRDHVRDWGMRSGGPFAGALQYPRMGHGMRQDSYPPDGGAPASNLAFMQTQLLDDLNIEFGLLHALNAGPSLQNQELGAAVCSAFNDWQIDKWLSKEPRLKGGISIPQEDTAAALREIDERSKDPRFVQVAFVPRSMEPAGRRRYWPIYERAEALDLPIGVHSAATGWRANSGAGWGSFYVEEHYGFAHTAQTMLTSMIFEGVFERFPKLKVVLVEGGFAWLAPLMWRMDREWERMREEVPHVTRRPSDYVKSNVWLTTQPVEEPPNVRHMTHLLNWIGWDKLMFSTDYPHWDFDHPDRAFRVGMSEEARRGILRDNALGVYNLT
ncbi:Amidohydrolase [Pseudooceanicola marinus]|uniref:Amidohydrolase n=1 Tax=Pseudooceanicola marinus TaxID=396013 RepID=A0A1X6YAG2_9RHOB|nr:amidohydrolase family protein [Pseudooceanicola marinus]PJE33104.1 amidohydrolase [Pseudooceanicola marinus]SLN15092.1 Amidohydrolase [Pseudooceanicola marinus]